MKTGYTLIELMIVITITALLVAFGIGGYTRAQKNQNNKAATEVILTALTEAQKKASTGGSDCNGEYLGQQVQLQSSTITTTALCQSNNGTPKSVAIIGLTFTSSHTVTFKPLNQGATLSAGSTENIDYSNSTDTYRIEVTSSGNIQNRGKL
jgi:prepilin-type N-terminal cleavage/methylation domain-containing protein